MPGVAMDNQKYRLITRSDFDGLVCAVLLNELNIIDEITFVHPKDMQDGKVPITARDITTNLPYVPGAHLVFDHHPVVQRHVVLDLNAPAYPYIVVYEHILPDHAPLAHGAAARQVAEVPHPGAGPDHSALIHYGRFVNKNVFFHNQFVGCWSR